jgi:nanoRNase/pAp phosphatase (c-di-AMP/oligoRNAs hydrolase)
LIIKSKKDQLPLDKKSVNYFYVGAEVDLIFVIGAQKLEDLGEIYQKEVNLFKGKTLVNIDFHPQNSGFGNINIFQPQRSSYSEMITFLLKNLNLFFDIDIATNLLLGLKKATNNFQNENVSADTFEAAAFCLKAREKQVEEEKIAEPTADWLAPKIYRGDTQV